MESEAQIGAMKEGIIGMSQVENDMQSSGLGEPLGGDGISVSV